MISKVSKQNKMDWVEKKSPSRHQSISKGAMNSFTDSLIKQAKDMKTRGSSYEDIAKKSNISVDTLKSLLSGDMSETAKTASCNDCERSGKSKKGNYLSDAEKAYESLRGHKSALPKDFVSSKKHILSATGRTDVTDTGGSHKQMGMASSPSIFDHDVIDRAIATKDNGEKIRETNDRINAQRKEYASRYETIDGKNLAEALKNTDLRKDAGVHNISGKTQANYSHNIPVNGMSIFETPDFGGKGDFSHIKKTDGEQLNGRRKVEAETKSADKKKWIQDSQKRASSQSAQAIFGKMIDSFLKD